MAACNQVAIGFLQIAGGRVETTIALPYVLTTECQKENYAMPEQAYVLAEQGFNVQTLFRSP